MACCASEVFDESVSAGELQIKKDNFWTVTWGACRMQQIGKVLTRLFFYQKKALQSLGFQPKIFCLVSMSMTEEIVI